MHRVGRVLRGFFFLFFLDLDLEACSGWVEDGMPNTGTPLSGRVWMSCVLYVVCGESDNPAITVGVASMTCDSSSVASSDESVGGAISASRGGSSSTVMPSFLLARRSRLSSSTSLAKRFLQAGV